MAKNIKLLLLSVGLLLLMLISSCQQQPSISNSDFKFDEVTIDELQGLMASGQESSVSITQAYIDRISLIDQQLNAVIELNPDAVQIAEVLDQERKQGKVRSSLHGIPVLIKDNIDTADSMLSTAGSLALIEAPKPKQDAFIVKKLRESGAVLLGKTNLSEWANFRSSQSSSGWSSRGGQTHNPYILDRTPCGSSAGSAVAVTANLTVLAIGTETDGSIICPSSNNGIVGIKPSLGLLSRSGIIPIAHSQDTAGPMGRTVKDAVYLLQLMVGHDPDDEITSAADNVDKNYSQHFLVGGLKDKRIGVIKQFAGRNARLDDVMNANLKLLREAGATVVDVDLPSIRQFGGDEYQVLLYEFKHGLNRYLQQRGGPIQSLQQLIDYNQINAEKVMPFFGQDILKEAVLKGSLEQEEYLKALANSKRLTQAEGIDALMSEHQLDALLAPSNAPGWPIDLLNGDGPNNYVSSSSLAAVSGYPSITVPAGFIEEWPIGISFIGSAFSEPILIEIAYAFEQKSLARMPPKFISSYELID